MSETTTNNDRPASSEPHCSTILKRFVVRTGNAEREVEARDVDEAAQLGLRKMVDDNAGPFGLITRVDLVPIVDLDLDHDQWFVLTTRVLEKLGIKAVMGQPNS